MDVCWERADLLAFRFCCFTLCCLDILGSFPILCLGKEAEFDIIGSWSLSFNLLFMYLLNSSLAPSLLNRLTLACFNVVENLPLDIHLLAIHLTFSFCYNTIRQFQKSWSNTGQRHINSTTLLIGALTVARSQIRNKLKGLHRLHINDYFFIFLYIVDYF